MTREFVTHDGRRIESPDDIDEHGRWDDDIGVEQCPWCGDPVGLPPPTGPVVNGATGRHYDDFWVDALDPEKFPNGLWGPFYHADCYVKHRALETRFENATLREFE